MLKIGLLGAGRIAGTCNGDFAHAGSTLVAVSDYFPENAQKLAAEYGAEARTTDEIIADPSIDAVLIATSTDTHSDLIEAATAAGKAVLCEKPVDLSLNAHAPVWPIRPTGQPVMIGFNRRFDPNFGAMKAALMRGNWQGRAVVDYILDPAPPRLPM